MNYFITGIDTDSGKTLASAILCEALHADYWKPIQAGHPKDSDTVRQLITNTDTFFHKERFVLNTPASPHAAAAIDQVEINISDFVLPPTLNKIIIEGAGGCLVPINDKNFVIDLATHFNIDVILVADLYLGSINHTLLTAALLKSKKINVCGLIFNGPPNPSSEYIILKHTGYKKLLHILPEKIIDQQTVRKYAAELKENFNE